MVAIFLSYASADRAVARRLAVDLESLGHRVWIDHEQIMVGASLLTLIDRGLREAEVVVVLYSHAAARSLWVEREWQAKIYEELLHGGEVVLPARLDDTPLPALLQAKRFADFRQSYAVGCAQLALALQSKAPPSVVCVTREYTAALHSETTWYTAPMGNVLSRPTEISVELGIPYLGKITGNWKPDAQEQKAAWELYIELTTRITVAQMEEDTGLLRESLTSLYSIFNLTRQILRSYGPEIARPSKEGYLSFGLLAIQVLNYVLRPVLSKWHPLLLDYEQQKAPGVSVLAHEQRWEHAKELRDALEAIRPVLTSYTELLADVAGVPTNSSST
jgi:hypothetical protein